MTDEPKTSGGELDISFGKKLKIHATKKAIPLICGVLVVAILAWVYTKKMETIRDLKRQVNNMRTEIEKGKP